MWRATLFICCLLGPVGCADSRPFPTLHSDSTETDAVPIQTETAPTPRMTSGAPTLQSRVLDEASRAGVRELIRGGRAAAQAGRLVEAFSSLRRALELDSANRQLRCETGYVAFLAGLVPQARELIESALGGLQTSDIPESFRRAYAMCLYNAGLVYQAEGNYDDARRAWTMSLSLRPNETVQARLTALPPVANVNSGMLVLAATMTTDEIARRILWHYMRFADWYGNDEEDVEEAFADAQRSTEIRALTSSNGATGMDAYLVELDPNLFQHYVVLVIRKESRVAAFEVLLIDNPGAFGVFGDGSIEEARAVDLVPGGAPEVLIRTTASSSDDNLGGCENFGSSRSTTVLCMMDPSIACALLTTAESSSESCDPCVSEFGEVCGVNRANEGYVEDGYALRVHTTEGRVRIESISSARELAPREGLIGEHSLATLIERFPLAPLPN